VLAQSKVQDKSNEITAIPALELLDVKGCIVTLMPWAQKPSRLRFSGRKPTILCLKANHPTLFQQIDTWFETARAEGTLPIPSEHTAEAGHHRTEIRKVWTFSLVAPSGRGMVGTANNCHRRTYPPSVE